MATITFKAKVERVVEADGSLAWECITVPKLTRRHCDMAAFMSHPVYGITARAGRCLGVDMFDGTLQKIRESLVGDYKNWFRLDKAPDWVEVDRSGFLARVTLSV